MASDHAGYELKAKVKEFLETRTNHQITDFGTNSPDSVDYPLYSYQVARSVSRGENERGILICATGIGMTIAANKVKGIRATPCHDSFTATKSRSHNDSNVLVMGAQIVDVETALEIVSIWLEEKFTGGRHERRVREITQIEEGTLDV
ncbi:ribose 5-phosphate isomerase B [Candidatus Hakubella thermalkaliphila]|uniref:ribose 5-phosphate isomerase B n=1 Tax=Candidatus Hakubella thermalkaliphila TaxID=2754717 RepID=UPI00280B7ADD|nr:ribose 5-phosphate isomerase B [Candidatus Hakubella thermalkaliphila]